MAKRVANKDGSEPPGSSDPGSGKPSGLDAPANEQAKESVDNKVGYKSPPRATQFRKGVSGNPSGGSKRATRKKKTLAELDELLNEMVWVTVGNRRRRMTHREALNRERIADSHKSPKMRVHLLRDIERFDSRCGSDPVYRAEPPPPEWKFVLSEEYEKLFKELQSAEGVDNVDDEKS
jgi:hypothetical protein